MALGSVDFFNTINSPNSWTQDIFLFQFLFSISCPAFWKLQTASWQQTGKNHGTYFFLFLFSQESLPCAACCQVSENSHHQLWMGYNSSWKCREETLIFSFYSSTFRVRKWLSDHIQLWQIGFLPFLSLLFIIVM